MQNDIEAPDFSIAENDGKLQIRVDSGKFMDSVFIFESFDLVEDESGAKTISAPTRILSMVANGVLRDKVQVEHQSPELIDEFDNTVATPIAIAVIKLAHEG